MTKNIAASSTGKSTNSYCITSSQRSIVDLGLSGGSAAISNLPNLKPKRHAKVQTRDGNSIQKSSTSKAQPWKRSQRIDESRPSHLGTFGNGASIPTTVGKTQSFLLRCMSVNAYSSLHPLPSLAYFELHFKLLTITTTSRVSTLTSFCFISKNYI
jgi:hypothetical protein